MCLYINICHWQLQNQYVEINGAFLVSCFKLTPDVKGLIYSKMEKCIENFATSLTQLRVLKISIAA